MKKTLTTLFLPLLCFSTLSLHAQSALRGGFVEGADVFFYMDAAKMNESPFMKAMEELQDPEAKAAAEETEAKFMAATGLSDKDVVAMSASMDLDNIDFENDDPEQFENAPLIMAVELTKSITLEQAKAGIEALREDGEMDVEGEISIATVDGMEVLSFVPESDDGPKGAYGTLTPDGKTFLMSLNTASLKGGLSRIAEGKTSAPTPDMGVAMQSIGNRQGRFVVVLPEKARAMIQESVQMMAAQGGMGAMMMPFASVKSLLISGDTAESLDFYLSLDLGNPGNAQQATGMVQGMLPMMMMQLGPQAAELSQKIKVQSKDTVLTLNVNITPEDVKKMKDSAGAGMMMP